MKRVFQIFDLSKSEQRVVLIITLVLVGFGFVMYERRVHYPPVKARSVIEPPPSPSPSETQNEQ
jgi:hypothetical protein